MLSSILDQQRLRNLESDRLHTALFLLADLFDLNGFLHFENALSPDELANAQAAVAEAMAAGKRGEAWCWNKAMEVSVHPHVVEAKFLKVCRPSYVGLGVPSKALAVRNGTYERQAEA